MTAGQGFCVFDTTMYVCVKKSVLYTHKRREEKSRSKKRDTEQNNHDDGRTLTLCLSRVCGTAKELPLPEGTIFESHTDQSCGFNVAGPVSRKLLQSMSNTSFETADFGFMQSRRIDIKGIPCVALRVSFTGDLGWEVYCAQEDQAALFTILTDAAAELGGGPVGSRALMSLRIEKGYGSWSREYSPEYWPQETGLDRLIKLDKDFLNKASYLAIKDNAPREHLCVVEVLAADIADATGGEPIFAPDGAPLGRVTSGGYGYSVGKSLALAYLRNATAGQEVDVMILGKPHRGVVLARPPFDPDGTKLRS